MKLIKKVNYQENIKHEGNIDILFIVYNDLVFTRKLKSCKILKSNFLQTFFIMTGIDNKHIELFFIFNSFVKFVTEKVKKLFYFLNFKNNSIIKKINLAFVDYDGNITYYEIRVLFQSIIGPII